ncbi:MAG: C40 family peptidase [Acidobacteriota bacterium]|nr:C40 family peptidase [Acidobacteriota bacterium]
MRTGLGSGRRIGALVASLLLLSAGSALGATHTSNKAMWWALPQIKVVAHAGLMGTRNPATFRPGAALTDQALATLVFQLKRLLAPPPAPATPPPPVTTTEPAQTTTDPTQTSTDPTSTTSASTTTVATTTTTAVTTTATTTTVAAPAPPPPPAKPPKVPHGGAPATMTMLDEQLVDGVGLDAAAAEFAHGARAAGLTIPDRFGAEVAARLLGLRIDHPAAEDYLELLPNDPATRAEAAYSAAQILHSSGWLVPVVQSLADTFSLPAYTTWQRRILDTAVARIGMPYVWGGTSDGPEVDFGVPARGGYDCSGFVWRVYKLTSYPGEGDLASVLRGRTTYVMSGEVPRSELIDFAHLQPADVIFFGAHGPRSSPSEVDHMGIYLGNDWFIQSSDYGVALARLTGGYRREFAWARRPLREAGLSG